MALTITYKAGSFFSNSTITGGTTVTCVFGGAPAVGELCLIAISWIGVGTLSTPSGWTKLQSLTGGNAAASKLDVYVRLADSTSNSFAFVASTSMSNCMATGRILQKLATSTWEVASVGGQDSSTGLTWTGTANAGMQVAVDDVIFSSAGADKNFGIGISAFSIGGGPTFAILSSTTSPLGTAQSGGFIAVAESFQACTANPSTATLTMNWTYTTNSTQGATAFVRVREIKNALPIVGPIHDDTVTMYGIPSAEAVGNIYFQQHDSHITLTGIPSAEAIGNLAILGPAAPCDCPDPVAVTLPTILDTVEAPETGRDILVDPTTNNLALTETGDLALVAGIDSIAQDLRHRCRTFTGEWFLALDAGLPWFTDILGVKKLNLATVRSLLRALIEDTPGVKNILSLDVALATATRALAITFRVDTDLGEFVETLTTPLAEEP